MANWYGSARSNYFKVKSPDVFELWAKEHGLEVWKDEEDPYLMGIHPNNSESGGWPSYIYNEEIDDINEFDLVEELAGFLQENEIAVLFEVGAEKLRYITGHAIAVHSSGKTTDLDLNEIYHKASKKFKVPINTITLAEY